MESESGRDENGRFTPGNSFGVAGGRPAYTNKAEYLRSLSRELTPEAWAKIVQKAILDATEGTSRERATGREWLGKYVLPQNIEVELTDPEEGSVTLETFEATLEQLGYIKMPFDFEGKAEVLHQMTIAEREEAYSAAQKRRWKQEEEERKRGYEANSKHDSWGRAINTAESVNSES